MEARGQQQMSALLLPRRFHISRKQLICRPSRTTTCGSRRGSHSLLTQRKCPGDAPTSRGRQPDKPQEVELHGQG